MAEISKKSKKFLPMAVIRVLNRFLYNLDNGFQRKKDVFPLTGGKELVERYLRQWKKVVSTSKKKLVPLSKNRVCL